MIKNCLNCKHCIANDYTNYMDYGFKCIKKRIRFDYNLMTVIRGFICIFYEQKEVKEDD